MARSKIGVFTRTYSFVQRYRQILFVLLKYGFDDLIASLNIEKNMELGWKILVPQRVKKVATLSRAARIRLVLEELGPTFIKLGQALSTRSDLLPEDILAELSLLQDRVPPFAVTEVKKIIKDELKVSCESFFPYFEETPLAAASIGQVHRARLQDGRDVAVKIQRPGIRRKIATDLEILHHLATLMEGRLEVGQVHKPTRVVDEFARTIKQELNYEVEAANIERFSQTFADNPDIHVYDVFREATTPKVLTMGFVAGLKPSNIKEMRERGIDPKVVAHKGCELVMDQVFNHGFFHADPHPGNILVLENNVICFLDFGMMGRLDRQSRELFADLLLQVVQHDEVKAADSLLKLTHSHSLINRPGLEREISELIDEYLYRPLKDLEVGLLIRRLLDLTVKHDLQIPAYYFLLIKAVTQIENLGRALDPTFDFTAKAKPYIQRLLLKRYHPRRIGRDLYETGTDLLYLMKEVPGEVRELLKQAKQGRVKIELEHFGLHPMRTTFERVSNRISSAIVLASLIVASSLIVLSGIPPKWHEIPVIGLAGYLFSGIMGLLLLRSIWRDRNR